MSRQRDTHRKHLDESGFSLIELMIVVAIIGVLASIALPRYQNSAIRARQSEGVSLLSAVYTLQITHKAETGRFGSSELEIGMDTTGQRRYNPVVFTNVSASTFTATIDANLDNDPTLDTWQLTHDNAEAMLICSDITNIGPAC